MVVNGLIILSVRNRRVEAATPIFAAVLQFLIVAAFCFMDANNLSYILE